jgi:hypothetical protein
MGALLLLVLSGSDLVDDIVTSWAATRKLSRERRTLAVGSYGLDVGCIGRRIAEC